MYLSIFPQRTPFNATTLAMIMTHLFNIGGRDDERELCWGCLGSFDKDMITILPNGEGRYCPDSYNQKFSTCLTCGIDFKDEHKVHLKCEKCRGEN